MKTIKISIFSLFIVLGGSLFYYFNSNHNSPEEASSDAVQLIDPDTGDPVAPVVRRSEGYDPMSDADVKPMPDFLKKSLVWLENAQARNGGFGAGQHSKQHIRDPHHVDSDPATTAFVGLAMMRVGNTLKEGEMKDNLSRALDYMLKVVDRSSDSASNITTQKGTQPQTKLGENIDVALATQFFIRISPMAEDNDELQIKVDEAIVTCLRKIENSQLADGSWNDRGWARVLSSAMANNALEMAESKGYKIDQDVLALSQSYQAKNVDTKTGKAMKEKSAGVDLYTFSSSQRATAAKASKVKKVMRKNNIRENDSESVTMAFNALTSEGYSDSEAESIVNAYQVNSIAKESLANDEILAGFGSNGGEEFLSYMMTSEAFIMSQDEQSWNKWHRKMSANLGAVMNQDGSWSGHHCITSPVFCTAAVVMSLTADRDQEGLNLTTF